MGNISDSIRDSIKDGVNIIKDINGNILTIVKTAEDGIISVFQNGILLAQDVEQNFFDAITITITEGERIIGTVALDTESKILATVDSFLDNTLMVTSKAENDIIDTIQVTITIAAIGSFVFLMVLGKPLLKAVSDIARNGSIKLAVI
jgi:hypothetical protein